MGEDLVAIQGRHAFFHRPTDTPDRLAYGKMVRIRTRIVSFTAYLLFSKYSILVFFNSPTDWFPYINYTPLNIKDGDGMLVRPLVFVY